MLISLYPSYHTIPKYQSYLHNLSKSNLVNSTLSPFRAVAMLPQTATIRVSWYEYLRLSSQEKNSISGNPLFIAFFSFLFINPWHQYYRLHMAREHQVDVLGWFSAPYVYGNMSMGFWHFSRKRRSRKQIDRRLRRSSIYFTLCKINS